MKPLISVLIDTYNHEGYIEQAVTSAVEQDFPEDDYEILVVDDGSTDRTPEIVRKFAPRVRLLRKTNGGQASALNAAFPELRGEFIALLDGDDWFAPEKLTAVMEVFAKYPEIAAVGHGYYEYHDGTNERKLRAPDGPQLLKLSTPEDARAAQAGWPFLVMCAHTVRRETLARVIPMPEELIFCADTPIIMASMAGGAYLLPGPLSYYRHHSNNLIAVNAKADAQRMRRRQEMLERTFQLMEPLLLRFGVSHASIAALLYPDWVQTSRSRLHDFGGTRKDTLRTELRSFHAQYSNPSLGYRLFKYVLVGVLGSVLTPRQFYTLWNWYGRQKIARFPEPLRKRG
ncbi:MAG: glycosyltransferase family 2 protein [Candidatus Acidiferrales bacterium]